MSYYSGPESLAANPPESWRVERGSGSSRPRWYLYIDGGHSPASIHSTKREALAERDDPNSRLRRAVEQERRWYAGEPVANWKTYAECLAEQQRLEQRQRERLALAAGVPADTIPAARRHSTYRAEEWP